MMFMVFYNDQNGLCVPFGADDSTAGAIHGAENTPVMFATWADAQKAIRISIAKAKLDEAQGRPVNEDFTVYRKNIRIVKVVLWVGPGT